MLQQATSVFLQYTILYLSKLFQVPVWIYVLSTFEDMQGSTRYSILYSKSSKAWQMTVACLINK